MLISYHFSIDCNQNPKIANNHKTSKLTCTNVMRSSMQCDTNMPINTYRFKFNLKFVFFHFGKNIIFWFIFSAISPIKIPNYIFRNGLRTVAPYYVKIERFARSTWVKKTLITALPQAYDLKPSVQLQMNNQKEIDHIYIDSSVIKKYLSDRKVLVRSKSLFSRNKFDIIDPETLNNLILNHSDYLSVLVHKHQIPVSDCVQETESKEEKNDK